MKRYSQGVVGVEVVAVLSGGGFFLAHNYFWGECSTIHAPCVLFFSLGIFFDRPR